MDSVLPITSIRFDILASDSDDLTNDNTLENKISPSYKLCVFAIKDFCHQPLLVVDNETIDKLKSGQITMEAAAIEIECFHPYFILGNTISFAFNEAGEISVICPDGNIPRARFNNYKYLENMLLNDIAGQVSEHSETITELVETVRRILGHLQA